LKVPITIAVNGQARSAEVEPRTLLVGFLRDQLDLTGTHVGCETSQCGACTVLTVQADGAEILTIEGLAKDGEYHPVQQGFWEMHGLQCGYCTPGMIMTAYALLERNPNPTEEEIRHALEGNLCRCTGYQNIVRAIQYAAGHTDANGASAPQPKDQQGEQLQPTGGAPHDPETVGDWGGELAGESDDQPS